MPRFRKSGNAPNIPSAGIVTNLGLAWLGLGKRRDRMTPISYRYHHFPPSIIRHAIWLYLRFTLSYRDLNPRTFQGSRSTRPIVFPNPS